MNSIFRRVVIGSWPARALRFRPCRVSRHGEAVQLLSAHVRLCSTAPSQAQKVSKSAAKKKYLTNAAYEFAVQRAIPVNVWQKGVAEFIHSLPPEDYVSCALSLARLRLTLFNAGKGHFPRNHCR